MEGMPSDAESPAEGRDLLDVQAFVRPLLEQVAARILALRGSGRMHTQEKQQAATDGKRFDLVTEADALAEMLIVADLRLRYPDDEITGEEGGTRETKHSDWRWEIDPIDGTINFARGDEAGISVALLYKNEPVMGVIHFLHDGTQMYAARGQGAFLYDCASTQETPLVVEPDSSTTELQQAYMTWDIGHGNLDDQMRVFTTLRPTVRYLTSHACYPASVRRVLEGKRDAYINTGAKAYDMAASIVIATEAGAVVSGIQEEQLRFSREDKVIPSIVARNRDILRKTRDVLLGGDQR